MTGRDRRTKEWPVGRLFRIALAVAVAVALPPTADDDATGLAEMQAMRGGCCDAACACGPVSSCGCAVAPPNEQHPRPALPAVAVSKPTAPEPGGLLGPSPFQLPPADSERPSSDLCSTASRYVAPCPLVVLQV